MEEVGAQYGEIAIGVIGGSIVMVGLFWLIGFGTDNITSVDGILSQFICHFMNRCM